MTAEDFDAEEYRQQQRQRRSWCPLTLAAIILATTAPVLAVIRRRKGRDQ